MNQVIASSLGAVVCCVVPLVAFFGGVYYARFGLPVALRWRGFGQPLDEESD